MRFPREAIDEGNIKRTRPRTLTPRPARSAGSDPLTHRLPDFLWGPSERGAAAARPASHLVPAVGDKWSEDRAALGVTGWEMSR